MHISQRSELFNRLPKEEMLRCIKRQASKVRGGGQASEASNF